MAVDVTICVGTLGQGIWRSGDGGETWTRVRQGLYSECCARHSGSSSKIPCHVCRRRQRYLSE